MTAHPSPETLPFLDLRPDEKISSVWRPEFRFFLAKLCFVSSLTALCLGTGMRVGTGISNPLLWLGAFILSAAVYAFIFDDFLEWRARKGDVWVLTNMHLVYFNPNDETSPAAVPLSAIETVSGWMFWGVRVRLVPRDQLMMLFLADRTTVRDTIRAHLPPKETTK